jgi:hypothetical protein
MIKRNEVPPNFIQLTSLFDAQPGLKQALFHYCLAQVLVEAGKAKLVHTTPGDLGPVCTFETATGARVSLAKPPLSVEQEEEVKQLVRRIIEEG